MAVTTTTLMGDSVRAQYHDKYIEGAKPVRLYDALAEPMPKEAGKDFLATSYVVSFLNDLGASETTISQVSDLTPDPMADLSDSVTPTSFGKTLQISELLEISAFTNFTDAGAGYYKKMGESLMESLELLAKKQAVCGTWVRRPVGIVRNTIDAGSHLLTHALLLEDANRIKNAKAPMFVDGNGSHPMMIGHSNVSIDILSASGQPLLGVGQYQDKQYVLNDEVGMLGGVRLSLSPFAHVFWGAGVANSTATVATTANGAVTAGDKTITLTTVGSLAAGMHLVVGSIETAGTLYPTTESVYVNSVSGSVATIIGTGSNGGFRFDHATLSTVSNADNVYPLVYGGPSSLVKIYASNKHGPFGMIVDPKITGSLDQWRTMGYKFYGNYGILSNNRLLRRECAASLDA